jgi:hypothetical protein
MDYNIIQGQSSLTNTGDVYSGTLSVGVTSYRDKGVYLCKISATNTTSVPTLNLNGIGAKTIVLNDGKALSAGSLLINGWYEFLYDSGSNKFLCLNPASVPYKSYVALLNQTLTNAPTAIVLQNSLGSNVSWIYDSPGTYYANCTGVFTENKTTVMLIGNSSDNTPISEVYARWYSVDEIRLTSAIYTTFTPTYQDGIIDYNAAIEIRVYY